MAKIGGLTKFSAVVRDKGNDGIKTVMQVDAENVIQAEVFIKRAAKKSGYVLDDGRLYATISLPVANRKLSVIEVPSPASRRVPRDPDAHPPRASRMARQVQRQTDEEEKNQKK